MTDFDPYYAAKAADLTEDDIDKAVDAFQTDMQKKVRAIVLRRLREWQAKYPKRSVAFMDAMGATMLHITRTVPDVRGDTTYSVDDMYTSDYPDRWRRILEPLFELVEWYNETSDTTNIGIADVLVGEPFWPIHVKGSGHFEVDPREYDQ